MHRPRIASWASATFSALALDPAASLTIVCQGTHEIFPPMDLDLAPMDLDLAPRDLDLAPRGLGLPQDPTCSR